MSTWRRSNQARRSNQSILKISPGYSLEGLMLKLKLQSLATWCEELTHLKSPWCWEMLRAGGEGDNRGWEGWMVSPTQRTWVWVDCRSWWWTGKPGVLWFMGSQRVRHDWATELNWTHSVVVRKDACYDFDFLKFIEVWFVTQDVFYPGECSMHTWEQGVFFCIWMACPEDINENHLI